MDYYKVLGVSKNASKEEIKQAYRKLAMEFHPDKHAQSSKQLKDFATIKFKQLSQAYDTLIDDQKRADYNIHTRSTTNNYYKSNYNTSSRGSYNNHGYGYGYTGAAADQGLRSGGFTLKMEVFLRFLTSRTFLLNAAYAGVLLGGSMIIDSAGKTVWEMQNSGKSFEEAMKKAKTSKDKL